MCKVISRHLHISTNYILHIHYGRNSKIAIQTLSQTSLAPSTMPISIPFPQFLSPSTYKRQASSTGNALSSSQHEHTQSSVFMCVLYSCVHTKVRGNCITGHFLEFYWTVVIIHNIRIYVKKNLAFRQE